MGRPLRQPAPDQPAARDAQRRLKHGIPLHDTTTLEITEAAVEVGMDREEVAACFTAAGVAVA